MDFALATPFLGQPMWLWLTFLGLVAILLVFDLGVLHRGDKEIGIKESLLLSGFYITLGVAFGGFVWLNLGAQSGVEYITGFVVEKSLAIDNIFVIATIFGALSVPRAYQHRVLFWGILGVIVLRAIMIGFGATLVAEYEWLLYVFAAFLLFTGARMLFGGDHEPDIEKNKLLLFMRKHFRVTPQLEGHNFFARKPHPVSGKLVLWITPLFVALVMVEIADVIFAVDSVPAIFAITTDPYVVYTSNIFAILGLRALYFALAAVLHRFAYLKQALAVLLIFIGGKVFVAGLLGWQKFPAEWSLGITFVILASGIAYSLWRSGKDDKAKPALGTSH